MLNKAVQIEYINGTGKIQKLNETYLSRCLIGILPRHQSGTKELHEKHAHAYQVIVVFAFESVDTFL